MKKLNKILLTCGGVLLLSGGTIATYLTARPAEQVSDLTLANIEALAVEKEIPGVRVPCCPAYWFNVCYFPIIMADGTEANGEMGGAINC